MKTIERPIEDMMQEIGRISDIQEIIEVCNKLQSDLKEQNEIEGMTDKQVKDLLISYKQCLYKTQRQLTS